MYSSKSTQFAPVCFMKIEEKMTTILSTSILENSLQWLHLAFQTYAVHFRKLHCVIFASYSCSKFALTKFLTINTTKVHAYIRGNFGTPS